MCKQEGNATFCGTSDLQESSLSEFTSFIVRFILFAAAHSLFAARWTKQLFSRSAEREPRSYRLIYNMASLSLLGWVMTAYRTSPLLYASPGTWKWLMYAAQLLTVCVIFMCIRRTGTGDFLGIAQLRTATTQSHRLVTSGWYAHVRHPLYLFSTLFLALNPVMTAQWALLTLCSVTYFIIGGVIEERRLLKEFGGEYHEYRKQVPFIIPALRILKRQHF